MILKRVTHATFTCLRRLFGRLKCPWIKSMTLSDGEYYEMVKSNFERADRKRIVRATTSYSTTLINLLTRYPDLLFN